jgi:hypothetical protein
VILSLIGLAMLSASWLFGLSYYHNAEPLTWAVILAVGVGLLTKIHIHRPSPLESLIAAVMLLPACVIAPWPFNAAPLLVTSGLILNALPIPSLWPKNLSSALMLVGAVMTVQSLAVLGYEFVTSRSHELPRFFSQLLLVITRLLGAEAALDGSTLALYTPRMVHRLGATWELFLDPVTLCFLTGGALILCLSESNIRQRCSVSVAVLILSIIAWLPVRTAILISIFLHRALRTGYDENLALMSQFWNTWLHLVLLVGPILLLLRFLPKTAAAQPIVTAESGMRLSKRLLAASLAFAGIFMLTMGLVWDTPGRRKDGRILVDEYHSQWERTDKPYDTNWYGQESGYNYACIYDYCSYFYQMSRLNTPISDAVLGNCDVLVVKTPTSRYGREEIDAIERFVEQGGGLLLMGEHTNVFNTGTFINEIADVFGFRFRYDCLFGIDSVFEQLYHPPLIPHPIIQQMPPLDFAVSCSIEPGRSLGRVVIRSTGLKNLPADYHASNFYPQVQDRAEMRYGAFMQLWAKRHGTGRVVGFTDSTIFSNFAAFEPGKAELMLGMLEWLNHRNSRPDLRPFLIGLGLVLSAAGLILAKQKQGAWVILLSAGMLGWGISAVSARAIHRHSMFLPKSTRPMVKVIIDRTICSGPLSRSGFISGQKDGFGIFERWILRLGYFTSRKQNAPAVLLRENEAAGAFTGTLLVFLSPNQTVSEQFRDALVEYVTAGGKVLILDSPENSGSTANSLLYPFGLTVNRSRQLNGSLKAQPDWPTITINSSCQIDGGKPIMWIDSTPIAASIQHGKGSVTVIGFGSRFTDANMGVTGDVIPDESLRRVFELQFRFLKSIVELPVISTVK